MKEKNINKHDTSKNWEKAKNFIPKAGEIIVYDDLGDIKIGDGKTFINDLKFYSQNHKEVYNGERR